jgi:acetate kinase
MKILVLNSGSSSQKSYLYEIGEPLPERAATPLWQGKIQWQGERAVVEVRNAAGGSLKEEVTSRGRVEATGRLLNALSEGPARAIADRTEVEAVGHRIVNGGPDYRQPALVNPVVKAAIERAAVFAPLHNRVELEGIHLVEEAFGAVPQVAVFDTGFHKHMPEAAAIYAGPYEWVRQGIRRYGFHGINHQYCAERAAQLLSRKLEELRLVTCHLGNGCSLAAIRGGVSIDTTMGFTPLEGLVMGTRSGSIDPGILTFLMRERKLTGNELDDLLNKKSGLLGISGISSDMREIVSAMREGKARAKLAFDIFVHRLRMGIGAMVATLGGTDALIFTAGIGENSPEVRAAACANFGFVGLELDAAANLAAGSDREISTPSSKVRVLVLKAEEDWTIAKECWKILRSSAIPTPHSSV